ncbi:MAG: PDZ domain-containing protein [Gemmataceae bacterium]|nr:PDZ domain-containing protein [Gemmataceae bacterium]
MNKVFSMFRRISILAAVVLVLSVRSVSAQEDLNDQLEKLTKDAAKKAGESVVQIETRGGTDLVVAGPKGQVFRTALGPTTGVIVAADGYIISSAFNFLNNPTTILVRFPGKANEPLVATRVATDKSRMLTLLKVEAKGLVVPDFVPKKDIKEGQWSIALGRALDVKLDKTPTICVGIISATNRVWGKAIQTDAKVSPINYGGPIVDMKGRVQGVLIPASPKGDDETAGFEWYDSGIGFAIPMEDILAVLPRLKDGKDLQKGLLGVAMKSQDMYGVLPEIGLVQPNSAASKSGLKLGDIITEIDGKPVDRMAQVLHALGVKYEGDKISLKYKRGGEVKEIKSLELVGKIQVIAQPFLGILPLRDDPKLGVEIRHVFDKSPADKTGLKVGDRIVKFGVDEKQLTAFIGDTKRGRAQLFEWLATVTPGTEAKLEVKRKGADKAEVITLVLDNLPGALPGAPVDVLDKLPELASVKKALAPLESGNPNVKPPKIVEEKPPMPETGLMLRNTPDGEHKYWLFVHEDYDPNVAHALLVWLHPAGKKNKEDFEAFQEVWEDYCKANHLILVMPVMDKDEWIPSFSDFVTAATRDAMTRYTVDRQRVIAHGWGVGGNMAIHLGFSHRDLFRGVCAVGAAPIQFKDNIAGQRLSFYLTTGELDPLAKSIAEGRTRLAERRYPAFYRQHPERGRDYLNDKQLREVIRWIDSLDQQ